MPPPTPPATAPEPGAGGRRIGRIIAQGFVASIPADPVPIAPGGVRFITLIAQTWTNAQTRPLVFIRLLSQRRVPWSVVRRLGQDR